MDNLRAKILNLTLALYRVSEKIPQEEPLRKKMREKASEILELFFSVNPSIDFEKKEKIRENIRVLGAFFKIASQQDWVDPRNFKILLEEYKKLYNLTDQIVANYQEKQGVTPQKPSFKPPETKPVVTKKEKVSNLFPSERQKRILELIHQKNRVSLEELRSIFSDISQRTLRRDLERLIKTGKIVRKRISKKDVIYEAKGSVEIGQNADATK